VHFWLPLRLAINFRFELETNCDEVVAMATRLHEAVEKSAGERQVHRELELRPWVMNDLVAIGCKVGFVVSHFKLGDEYEADFVVLHGFSGGWEVHLIELEPPAESPFNARGDFSGRMNHAAGQIRRWKQFYDRVDKRPYFVAQLRDAVVEKDLIWRDGREPLDSASMLLTDPRSLLIMCYHVIMGRRQHFTPEWTARKAALVATDGFELITYDRVLDVWDRQRKDKSYPRARRMKTKL
jgi:antiviral defense system Shedu protein SduA